MERVTPSFIRRRQQHINFTASLGMEFVSHNQNECAGLLLFQNDDNQIRCVVTLSKNDDLITRLIRRETGKETVLLEQKVATGRQYRKVEASGQAYQFYVSSQSETWQTLGNPVDGRVLSTPVAGGFTGAYTGMYASNNGIFSGNGADFDWFEYSG